MDTQVGAAITESAQKTPGSAYLVADSLLLPPLLLSQNPSSRWAHPLVRPELGCLIIAKEDQFTQQQQYFYKAVALVIQHGDDGTVALILNRPTTFTMGDVCTGDLLRVPGMEDNVRNHILRSNVAPRLRVCNSM